MSTEQTTEQQTSDQTQQANGEQSSASEGKEQKHGLDQQSFAKLMKDVGAQQARKEIEAIFGTAETEQLKAYAEKLKGEGSKKTAEQSEEVLKKIQELENKIKEKETAHAQELQKQKLIIAMSKHSPSVPDLILTHFQNNYEVKTVGGQEVVYKRGADLPEQVDNEIATVDKFFSFMATKSEIAPLFKKATPTGAHVDTSGGYVDERNTPVTPEQAKDPAFIEAMEASGELTRYYATGKVDMTKIKAKLKR